MRYAFSNVFEDPFWLTTIPMALVGWVVALVGSVLNNVSYSSQFPVFSWWGVAFEMVAILLTLHVAFSNEIRMYRLAVLACLSIATVYTTNSTNNFVWRNNSSSGAAAAGNILLSIINIIWILYFGTTQDEVVHSYIDSFASRKKMSPTPHPNREKRGRSSQSGRSGPSHHASLPTSQGSQTTRNLGTSSRPYRMSDVLQNISIGDPTNFSRQTDRNDPANTSRNVADSLTGLPDLPSVPGEENNNAARNNADRNGATLSVVSGENSPYNPLNSTYLYSVDQLQRHGLASHEASNRESRIQQRFSTQSDTINMDAMQSMEAVARVRARFSYDARIADGEIPFREGEVLDVCDMSGNWWFCRRENGEVGICPMNYLDLLDD